MENTRKQPIRRIIPHIFISGLVILLLSGAAFIYWRSLSDQKAGASKGIEFIIPHQIPGTTPELKGMILSVEGETFLIQESKINETPGSDQGSVVIERTTIQSSDFESEGEEENSIPEFSGLDGLITELVLTRETKIFQNVTQPIEIKPGEDEITVIEMSVIPGAAEDLGENCFVTVWGDRRGDRVIANVILFRKLVFHGN